MERPTLRQAARFALGLTVLVVAVVGVIGAGEGLRAPPRLATRWSLSPSACLGGRLEVEQSGVFLILTGEGQRLDGRLDGDKVRVAGTCAGSPLRLSGTWTADALALRGTAPGCAPCEEVRGVPEGAP